jgi:hypothetical protein
MNIMFGAVEFRVCSGVIFFKMVSVAVFANSGLFSELILGDEEKRPPSGPGQPCQDTQARGAGGGGGWEALGDEGGDDIGGQVEEFHVS